MKNPVVEAYKLGRATALQKAALFDSYKEPELGDYFSSDRLKPTLTGAGVGALGGALIGGKYYRGAGALGGALTGAIAANPELVLYLLRKGADAVGRFFNKQKK